MSKSGQAEVLEYLRKNGESTAREIKRDLGRTSSVRNNLNKLERNNEVRVVEKVIKIKTKEFSQKREVKHYSIK